MRNSEGQPQGGQRFGLRTGERRTATRGRTPIDTYPPTMIPVVADRVIAPTREKELAPPPTKEEADKANRGAYAGETRVVEKVGGNRLLKATLGGTAVVAGGAVAYEAVPAFHQAVDSAFLDHIKGFLKGSTIEERFPIKLEQSSFTPVSKEEEQELWKNTKTVDLENHTFTIGFPVDQATINKSPNLRMNSYFEPSLYAGVNVSELGKQGIKNVNQLSGLPKDALIAFNYNPTKFDASIIAIGIAGVTQGQGANSFTPIYTTYLVIQRDKQSGEEFQSILSALYGKPLVLPAPYPEKYSPVYENGTPIKPDEPILQLTTDLQDGAGQGRLLPGDGGQVVLSAIAKKGVDPNTGTIISLSPVFLQTPDRTVASRE